MNWFDCVKPAMNIIRVEFDLHAAYALMFL